jgi:hypothetical protein
MLHALKLTSTAIFFVWIKVIQFNSEVVWATIVAVVFCFFKL